MYNNVGIGDYGNLNYRRHSILMSLAVFFVVLFIGEGDYYLQKAIVKFVESKI